MAHQLEALPFTSLKGISDQTNSIHHDKLYAGYVNKRNEVEQKIAETSLEDLGKANQIYSPWRGLKEGETFAANGMILHQLFFSVLGGDGEMVEGKLKNAIELKWGSVERFLAEFKATAMAARGWAILAFDPSDGGLHIYAADAQNQGGVWGCTPLLPLDVYEHAYIIDFGADRASYIQSFLENVNWNRVEETFSKLVP